MTELGVLTAIVLTAATGLTHVLSGLLDLAGPIRRRHWLEDAGGALQEMLAHSGRLSAFRAALAWGARATAAALVVVLQRQGRPLLGLVGSWVAALGILALFLLLLELVTRRLAMWRAESALAAATPLYRLCRLLLSPLFPLLGGLLAARAHRVALDEDDEASRDEIEAFIRVGAREGILDPAEEHLVWRIVAFGDAGAHTVMTPRTRMVCGSASGGLEELKRLFLDSKHSRLPLYESSIDDIVGVLHLRDLMSALERHPPPAAVAIAKRPIFVPESRRLPDVLRDLQSRQLQMAIVVDEYGGTAGLVTVEDLVEEIVGEILDEHEAARPLTESLPDGSWRLDGAAPVAVLEELFGVDTTTVANDTVGGLLFGEFGELPRPGARVRLLGLEFTVERVGGRRIYATLVRQSEAAS